MFVYWKNKMAAKLNSHMVKLKTMALPLPFYILPGVSFKCIFLKIIQISLLIPSFLDLYFVIYILLISNFTFLDIINKYNT